MCGIAGIFDFQQPDPLWIRSMADVLSHRGPDARGFHESEGIALAHLRLSILDTSSRGNQPMQSPDGRYTLIHNGEIYNFKEVRSQLHGHSFETETDTEVILAAFEAWGPECLQHFNGMFAFAIWDAVKQELFLARDRMGIKPMYLMQQEGKIAFASEIRALMQLPWANRKINRNALAGFLTYQTVYGHSTLLEQVEELGAGQYALVNRKGVQFFTYWKMEAREGEYADRESVKKEVRLRLRKAVERRLVSDVPLGAFLSGGIDSSAIVALMSEVATGPVDTFSVVFQEKQFDESTWSEMVARKFNTRHHPILLHPDDFLDELPAALKAMDHPSGDGINSYVVAQMTRREGITVALSGLGGDELFAGYPVFTGIPAIQHKSLWKLPFPLRKLFRWGYKMLKEGREADKIRQVLNLERPDWKSIYQIYRTIYRWEQAQKLTGTQGRHPLDFLGNAGFEETQSLSRVSVAEMQSYTHSVLLRDMDQMSMAHALEARVPFFDHELVDYVLGIPDEMKWPHSQKQLLVDAMGDLLPAEVVNRPKMGFVFPWENWLRNELRSFCGGRLESLAGRGLVNGDALLKMWGEFQQSKGPWLWTHVWLPVVLEEWIQNNLEGVRN